MFSWLRNLGSERAGSFTSISAVCWSMVISKRKGRIAISLHGPKTRAKCMDLPAELEWFGIDFKTGAFMPHIPPSVVMDGNITLPEAADHAFWLCSSSWQFPNSSKPFVEYRIISRTSLKIFSNLVRPF